MSALIPCGVAVRDITPPLGLSMSGFAVRAKPAESVHDPLTARALAVGDTAILVADVIGLDGATTARIRARAKLPEDRIIVAALHNHGGPVSMADRLGEASPEYLARLEQACVEALDEAFSARALCSLSFGEGADPAIGRNRRHRGGPVDPHLPVLAVRDGRGALRAMLVAYACHPVVLGADNLAWTADYPHFVRRDIERAHPGATAIFLTAATGDVNTGHSAHDSMRLGAAPSRSFAEAERIGALIARHALAARLAPLEAARVAAARAEVTLDFLDRDPAPPAAMAARWREEARTADASRRAVLAGWIGWAGRAPSLSAASWRGHVTALDWAGLRLVGLPGEPFVATGERIRRAAAGPSGDRSRILPLGYCDDNPGYVAPADEYAFGGYEIDEAHRLYGMRAAFAPGSAERLESAAEAAANRL